MEGVSLICLVMVRFNGVGHYPKHEWCRRRKVIGSQSLPSNTDDCSIRWRNSRGQQSTPDQNQNPNQPRHPTQRQTGRGSVVSPRTAGPDLTTMSGNAWINNDRGNREAAQQGPAQEQHVPVNGFNAQDARNILKIGLFPLGLHWERTWLTYPQGLARRTRKLPATRTRVNHREAGPGPRGHQNVCQTSLYSEAYAECQKQTTWAMGKTSSWNCVSSSQRSSSTVRSELVVEAARALIIYNRPEET